jgi:4-hydroxybenzoate polyprenyltransferase
VTAHGGPPEPATQATSTAPSARTLGSPPAEGAARRSAVAPGRLADLARPGEGLLPPIRERRAADPDPPGGPGGPEGGRTSPIRALLALARPAGVWAPTLLPLLGYGWAHWDRAVPAWRPEALLPLSVGWLLLNVGTLWLNAARDRDRGDVLFGRAVEVPPMTSRLGWLALLGAVMLAAVASPVSGLCALAAAALAALYSHPRTAWKGHPVLGPAVNVVGYGLLSPLAGAALLGAPPTARGAAVLAALALCVLGATFAARAFQRDEDAARGDRTLVVTHGPGATLLAARACFAASALAALALVAAGWLPWLLAPGLLGAFVVDRHLARWARDATGGTERDARGLVWRGLAVLAAVLALALTDYVAADLADRPVAGLSTRSGLPPDRAPDRPSALKPRDLIHRATTGRPYATR